MTKPKSVFTLFQIKRCVLLPNSSQAVLDFFESIEADPGLYAFNSHAGVFPIQGKLAEIGSLFGTREKFAGITLNLKFQTTLVDPSGKFSFVLLNPFGWLRIGGYFTYEPVDAKQTKLCLSTCLNQPNWWQRILGLAIFLPPTRWAIGHQLKQELLFISRQIKA